MDAAFSEHTRMVAVTQVSNVLGCVNDIPELVKRARACGAAILMDAAQSAPHMPIDVQKLDVDFVAFSGHKMLAPMGIGVLYGKQEPLEKMPPFLTGGEMIETVSRYDAVYAELPHKFEAGTVNAGGAVGLAAAIDYLESYGMDKLHAVEQELTAYLFRGMKAIPHIHVLGSDREDNHTGIVSFAVDQVHPHDISEVLSSDGMDIRAGHHCAQPLHDHLGVHSTAWRVFPIFEEGWALAMNNFYNEILTEHNVRPEFKYDLECPTIKLEGVNPSCGDDIWLNLVMKDGVIQDASFNGDGCAISQASADIMIGMVLGKTKEEALHLADLFLKMIKGTATDAEVDELEEASALQDISHMPARVKCAVLGWRTLREAIEKLDGKA